MALKKALPLPQLMNVQRHAMENHRCLLLEQMTMVIPDVTQQVAYVFVKQLHQQMANVVKSVTLVIVYTNTRILVISNSYIVSK